MSRREGQDSAHQHMDWIELYRRMCRFYTLGDSRRPDVMNGLFGRFLATALSALMTGALGFCPCGNGACGHMGPVAEPVAREMPRAQEMPEKPVCPRCHPKKLDNGTPSPAKSKSDSNQRCNCKPTVTVERITSVSHIGHFNHMAMGALPLPVGLSLDPAGLIRARVRETIFAPALLSDLFHSYCLLTV